MINLPPTNPGPNRITFEEMAELMSWAAAAANAYRYGTWIVEEQADPATGQMERIGRLPDGNDFFSVSLDRHDRPPARRKWRRHLQFWKMNGEWIRLAVRSTGGPHHYRSLRVALECTFDTIGRGLRPARPDEPVDGYNSFDEGYAPCEWEPRKRR